MLEIEGIGYPVTCSSSECLREPDYYYSSRAAVTGPPPDILGRLAFTDVQHDQHDHLTHLHHAFPPKYGILVQVTGPRK